MSHLTLKYSTNSTSTTPTTLPVQNTSVPFQLSRDISQQNYTIDSAMQEDSSSTGINLVVGSLLGAIGLVFLLIVFVYVYKKSQRNTNKSLHSNMLSKPVERKSYIYTSTIDYALDKSPERKIAIGLDPIKRTSVLAKLQEKQAAVSRISVSGLNGSPLLAKMNSGDSAINSSMNFQRQGSDINLSINPRQVSTSQNLVNTMNRMQSKFSKSQPPPSFRQSLMTHLHQNKPIQATSNRESSSAATSSPNIMKNRYSIVSSTNQPQYLPAAKRRKSIENTINTVKSAETIISI